MVVFIRPTLVNKEIFASSSAKAGVSIILSLRTLEHFPEFDKVVIYRSLNLTFVGAFAGGGNVNIAFVSENM